MPLEALSAKARLTVPVGAIDSRWLLRMPCLRMAAFSGSSQAAGEGAIFQVLRGVEGREHALFPAELDRSGVGRVAHAARDAHGHVAARFLVVAQAQHGQRIAHAGEAHADAALGRRFGLLLRQRPERQVEHVVERAHLHRDRGRKRVEVELRRAAEAEGLAHEARQDDGAEVAAAVGGQRLLAARIGRRDASRNSAGCCRG